MRKFLFVLFCALILAACGDPAKETYETARLEEQQFNEERAARLYRQILEKHPDSPYSEKAAERLAELEGANTDPSTE